MVGKHWEAVWLLFSGNCLPSGKVPGNPDIFSGYLLPHPHSPAKSTLDLTLAGQLWNTQTLGIDIWVLSSGKVHKHPLQGFLSWGMVTLKWQFVYSAGFSTGDFSPFSWFSSAQRGLFTCNQITWLMLSVFSFSLSSSPMHFSSQIYSLLAKASTSFAQDCFSQQHLRLKGL